MIEPIKPIASIMQPYFFPYIGYYQLIDQASSFIVLDDVNFIKKGYINRNQIEINRAPWTFTIPLDGASQHKKIHEINLSQFPAWRSNFLKTLEQNYKKFPFFKETFTWISSTLPSDATNLADFLFGTIQKTIEYLEISTPLLRSSAIDPNSSLTGEDRIISLCKSVNAKSYVNPSGGVDLYHRTKFVESNLDLYFLKSKIIGDEPVYSLIHELMNHDKSGLTEKLKNFSYIQN